jgi:hypothetical protein
MSYNFTTFSLLAFLIASKKANAPAVIILYAAPSAMNFLYTPYQTKEYIAMSISMPPMTEKINEGFLLQTQKMVYFMEKDTIWSHLRHLTMERVVRDWLIYLMKQSS